MPGVNLRKLTRDFILEQEQREGPGGRDRHPYAILLDMALGRGPNGESVAVPLTVRLLAAQSLLRTRLAVKSQAVLEANVQHNQAEQRPGRAEIIAALSAASPEELKKV